MKHILILLNSILLLSSPLFGQSSKYESVSQCVLQTMKESKLTGNDMFNMVKEECERSLGNTNKPKIGQNEDKKNEVLYSRRVNGEDVWYKRGDEKRDGKYVGGILNGKPDGHGTFKGPNGAKMVGEWKDGKLHGQGSLILSNGDKIVGGFKDGEMDGQITATSPDGDKFVAEFKDGLMISEPIKSKEKGILYGRMVNGKSGYYKNGDEKNDSKYVGEIKNGVPNGQGIETFPSGNKFEGEFKDGKPNGHATYTFSSGKYVGEWKNGEWDGQGTETGSDGVWVISFPG